MAVTDTVASARNLVRIEVRDVIVGMFIYDIDRKWSEVPFAAEGFHVRKAEQIQLLQKFCKTVVVDTNRGAAPVRSRQGNLTILSSARRSAPVAAAIKVQRDTYPVTHTIKQQIDSSAEAYRQAVHVFTSAADAVRAGDALPLNELRSTAEPLLRSLIANPQTLIWLLITESRPLENHAYCVRAAIWAAMLGRQVGLERKELESLYLGTLLADIGLNLLPERLVNKRGHFRKKEYLAYRKHVEFGAELLARQGGLDEKTLRIVRCHHERQDGRGFPRGLRGDRVPPLARFAHIAYSFERLLQSNNPKRQVSPARAMSRLYKQRELKFPQQLVVEFIHVMGMYPVGTVIRLSNAETALVLEQNADARMFPRVGIIRDAAENPLAKPRIVDLGDQEKSEQPLSILSSLDPNALDLDLSQYSFRFWGRRLGMGKLSFRI